MQQNYFYLPIGYIFRLLQRAKGFAIGKYLGKHQSKMNFDFCINLILFIIYLTSSYQEEAQRSGVQWVR